MEIVTLLVILSLISLMVWDCTRRGIVEEFKSVSVNEFIRRMQSCRRTTDGKHDYDLGLPRQSLNYGSRVDSLHSVNTSMNIRTWIDIRGDLIEVLYKGKMILCYVDQTAQYGFLQGTNDINVDKLFYDRRVQKMLRDVILVSEITNGINDFKEKYPNAF